MKTLVPARLAAGDEVRVIAPSRSLAIISDDNRREAMARLESLGLRISFGHHVLESDIACSSSVESRLADLHDAFADPDVKGILTVIGGYNANQLLARIDYDLVTRNSKVFCGYSDITALGNALFARSHLITYSGPHFSTFAMRHGLDEIVNWFRQCLFDSAPFRLNPGSTWSDDRWFEDQERRHFHPNPGPRVLQAGMAEGTLIGGNLGTLHLLQGTPFMPPLDGAVLFAEEDEMTGDAAADVFDRYLVSLLQTGARIAGLMIGRFQRVSAVNPDALYSVIRTKPELRGIPVIADLDFGHTVPFATLPIGGRVRVVANDDEATIDVIDH